MKRNQLKIGSMLSYVQTALGIIISLIYTPTMIRLLGQSEYGLYNTVASTISMLSLLSLGFNSGYVRYYSIYRKNNQKESISKLNGLFLIIFLIIGLVCFICGLFLSFHLNLVFDEGLTASEYGTARILTLLLTISLAVSFPMSVFQNIISAHEQFIFLKLLGMINTIIGPALTLPLLFAGYRSIAMVAVSVGISLFTNFIYLIYVLYHMKEKFIFHDFEKGIFRNLFLYTIFIAMNSVIDQINWNIDKLLLGRFLGTAEVAVYAVGYSLYGYYMSFSTAISGVFTPRIHSIVNVTKDNLKLQRERLTELFIKVGRIQFLILGLVATGVCFFGKYFIVKIWAGTGYENSYAVALLLIIPASIALIQNMGIEIQRAQNRHQFRSLVYLGMALVNLGLSIFLCQRYGAIGSAIGTAFSLILANGIIMNIYYYRKCNIDVILFWKNILRQSVGLILPILSGIIIWHYVPFDSIFKFAMCIVAYMLIYCASMWLFGMNEYEKDFVRNPVRKILKRRKRR